VIDALQQTNVRLPLLRLRGSPAQHRQVATDDTSERRQVVEADGHRRQFMPLSLFHPSVSPSYLLLSLLLSRSASFSRPCISQLVDVLSHLSSILSKSSMIGEKEINYLEQQTRLYWRAREEYVFPANILYHRVIRHINDITAFLIRSLLPNTRQYLCEIVCRAVLLAGVLLYDMGQYEKARQHYLVASQAASEANNFILQALVWG
jgi:hypothetical protein